MDGRGCVTCIVMSCYSPILCCAGGTAPFQLYLQGSTLMVQTTRKDLAGKKVTVSLDGLALASGGRLSKCSSQRLQERQVLNTTCHDCSL